MTACSAPPQQTVPTHYQRQGELCCRHMLNTAEEEGGNGQQPMQHRVAATRQHNTLLLELPVVCTLCIKMNETKDSHKRKFSNALC